MKTSFPAAAVLALLLCSSVRSQDAQVLPSGPVHEAFATAPGDREPAPLIDQTPPEPLNEELPDDKPDVDNVQWIGGYWSHDPQKKDFVWVSGVWRLPPPGQQWVAGYWNQVGDRWQRVPGLWSTLSNTGAAQPVAYLPRPPAVRVETPGAPPQAGSTWVAGSWQYGSSGYTWSPGQWIAGRPGWMWTAPSYSWTPAGYVWSRGYWDYGWGRRGLAFAPLYVPAARRRTYVYRPTLVIAPATFSKSVSIQSSRTYNFNNARFVNLRNVNGVRLTRLSAALRTDLGKLNRELHQLALQRKQLELKAAKDPRQGVRTANLRLPPHRVPANRLAPAFRPPAAPLVHKAKNPVDRNKPRVAAAKPPVKKGPAAVKKPAPKKPAVAARHGGPHQPKKQAGHQPAKHGPKKAAAKKPAPKKPQKPPKKTAKKGKK